MLGEKVISYPDVKSPMNRDCAQCRVSTSGKFVWNLGKSGGLGKDAIGFDPASPMGFAAMNWVCFLGWGWVVGVCMAVD